MRKLSYTLLSLLFFCSPLRAAGYSAAAEDTHPNRLFWGDTHVHSNLSTDAFSMGNRSLGPEQAYRFARGETVTSQGGLKAQLARPLDFMMVADHGAFLGVMPELYKRSPEMLESAFGRRWIGHLDAGEDYKVLKGFAILSMGLGRVDNPEDYVDESHAVTLEYLQSLRGLELDPGLTHSLWSRVGKVADEFNDPGQFTTFIGYEWTSTPGGNNLHRNVLFRDGADRTSQVVPFTSIDSSDPEDLWRYLGEYEAKTGGSVMAIPHNGNLSNGLMFAETTYKGAPLDKDYAQQRAYWEPIIEVTQIKGDSESHPFLSPNDEFADFEKWDRYNLFASTKKQNNMLQYEYARPALATGLALGQALGVNPFQFGMIGSTDSHTSLATADEDNFFGKQSNNEPAPGRSSRLFAEGEVAVPIVNWELSASGYAAVWARKNTREALFDALRRRETYATTGPRISVRFFASWDFEASDIERPDFARFAYQHGVSMGSELTAAPASAAPKFMAFALKDPLGANLDRLQIVKSWVDSEGERFEKVYNVAASDGRAIRGNTLEPLASTVDISTASYRNSTGAVQLATVWEDPDFDPVQHAVYYLRVLEIPTPRWTTIDAVYFSEPAAPEQAPAQIQERAYTSPIWYVPGQ